jgi:dolichyl-diphosphooligosaccharide--protein glycosyltransferase
MRRAPCIFANALDVVVANRDRTRRVSVSVSRRVWIWAGVLGVCTLGLLLRISHYREVFSDSSMVLLGVDDAFFHARRALYSFVNFPAVLHFDPYIAYPDGSPAPSPPLFDWVTAAVARLFGDDVRTLEVTAAWVTPVTGALFALPAYAIGRSIATPAVGLVAALLTALLPSGLLITRLGNFDHHGAVALIAACWLAASVSRTSSLASRCSFQAAAACAMLFTWSGSLLYLALAAGAQFAAFVVLTGGIGMLRVLGLGLAAAAIPTALWLATTPAPLGGPFSDQTLSWLHFLGLLAIVAVALGLSLWEERRDAQSVGMRALRLVLVGLVVGAPLLLLPAVRSSLLDGLAFLGKRDVWAGSNPEQLPLFHSSSQAADAAIRLGWFAYLVPALPLYVGIRLMWSEQRQGLMVLLVWLLVLTALLLSQVRYGTDYTVVGCVALALVLRDVRRLLARALPAAVATALIVAATVSALYPAYTGFHRTGLRYVLATAEGDDRQLRPRRRFWREARFATRVRELTPDPGGFFDASLMPSYGIVTPITMGHHFLYAARRPVPANNLGPYLDIDKYRLVDSFYKTRDREEALQVVERLGARYVVTARGQRRPRSFSQVLHRTHDSAGPKDPSSGRLRLVEIADPIRQAGQEGGRMTIPLKLFELVEGALLQVKAPASARVRAEIEVTTRAFSFEFRAWGHTDATGVASLRVPYATGQGGAVSTADRWRVEVGDRILEYRVEEVDVQEGRTVEPLPGQGQGAALWRAREAESQDSVRWPS